jgi:hypothetical protein
MKAKRYLKAFVALSLAATALTVQLPSQFIKTAYAEEIGVTKTATLNDIKVSFNGAEPVTIQAYNVDGVNYVRAKDVTDGLNMHLELAVGTLGETLYGIRIIPEEVAVNPGSMEKLTQTNIQVNLFEGEINYKHRRTFAQCFNHEGRYYFSLADIDKASKASLQSNIDLAKGYAASPYATGPAEDSYTAVDVINDTQTGVINVKRNVTDLWAVYNQAKGVVSVQESAKIDPSTSTLHPDTLKQGEAMMNGTWKPIEPEFKKQAPLTEAPKVGTRLANILIDESQGAYDDAGLNEENIQPFYKYNGLTFNFGECAWYAEGRFSEVTGVDSKLNEYWVGTGNVSGWLENVTKNNCPDVISTRNVKAIKAQSIAVWDGHVAFVEYVEYNSNGNPTQVYFTEANAYHDVEGLQSGIYYPQVDCIVKTLSFDDFINRSSGLLGYVMAK